MSALAILLLAAGASRRMRGRDKLMEEVSPGCTLLRDRAIAALETGATVLATLPSERHPRAAALAGLDVRVIPVPNAVEGMAASIRAGVAALDEGIDGMAIVPADMPELRAQDLGCVFATFEAAGRSVPVQATAADGTPGHPVLFPRDCFEALGRLQGDAGARAVLRSEAARLQRVALPGRRALTDLDTPEAWAMWRRSRD